ncbi:type II toxin-antitoxin system PemK/MazF family toxin [endosymbiont GvMRE of Glomus versiforme]|uniref:type II toxin-antitoxin system PemK/MazF family toxin n=1 Tax=endosymbiont GvMRE of Glomus versiforme TaxID=2039283 RepID=UPI000EC67745|nr:type II toxin-antitoxin system PemK/MazF family toxin [endosymbiont GvMRE of Glomus versiforme]RHZ35636.1 hypothetical protein GvMRE_IIg386 [endosymbiont GvMRE of Glomus versiforme]
MKKKSKNDQTVVKGDVFWFDPLKETKIDGSPLALILSGKLHNEHADHFIITLVSSKSIADVRDFFEVLSEVEDKKIKIITYIIHAVGKESFLKQAKYLGRLNKEALKKINEKVKLILELDN